MSKPINENEPLDLGNEAALKAEQLEQKLYNLELSKFIYNCGTTERRLDFICLIYALIVLTFYAFPPIKKLMWDTFGIVGATGTVINNIGNTLKENGDTVGTGIDLLTGKTNPIELGVITAGKAISDFIPDFTGSDLQKTPKKGDEIAGFIVTSPWGARDTNIPGASTFHRGVDLGTPIGTPLYAFGNSGATVTVTCNEEQAGGKYATYDTQIANKTYTVSLLHLSVCTPGSFNTGTIIAQSGDTGIGSGAHMHLSVAENGGDKEEPKTWMLWATMTGQLPQELFKQE